jgi:2,4-dienoyl-CoA reductase-like NADH-dependent reductase (Old Yellow Enzyme family)
MSSLIDPVSLGSLELPNRFVMAPMTRARAGEERMPNPLMGEYYVQRASAGLIVTEATVISRQGIGWPQSPGIYDDSQLDAWRDHVVRPVHDAGARIVLQLWHCGRASHSAFHNGELPPAPSAVKLNGDQIHTPEGKKDYETPRAMTANEIAATVADYRAAAERARAAGFDGIEIHAANGYLIDQFLQSKTNLREDAYGGSVENRYRFLGEVMQAVLQAWPADRVGVRLAPNGVFNDMGSPDYREQFSYAAKQLGSLGLAYLHLLDGLAFGFHELGTPMTLAEFRELTDTPLVGNCGYTFETATKAVEAGHADAIAFGRPYISNPDLVERFRNGWPLAEDAPMDVWYSFDERGYADWPSFSSQP